MVSSFLKEVNALDSFTYNFPAIRGIQAGREYYISMCPLKLIPKIFIFDESTLPAQLRAQRTLNKARIPDIAQYLVDNPKDYVFSAISASISGAPVQFIPAGENGMETKIGAIIIPMDAQFIINDGQHRRAAIEAALIERPELANETIAVVFFIDTGLKRSQQIFSDLNRHAVRPTKSISILYDYRDPFARFVMDLAATHPLFKGFTELEKTTISNRSIKMFTLSSLYQGTQSLLNKKKKNKHLSTEDEKIAREFWEEVSKNIPEWDLLIKHKVSSSELRTEFVHAHGLAIHALGIMGQALIKQHPEDWKQQLEQLQKIDWLRSNEQVWEGRAMNNGRISKAQMNLTLTVNYLKQMMNLPLTNEEERVEKRFLKQTHGGIR
ncbi:DNA sulfur modification protein DndB [Methanosphaerula palustris]|uniref:DNA sulfur modification protein DndB n=1 Tax=Methanosphaerula palustris (strain ATCC BAA-1556 / DSM 19958 / E1-9c) TaxID=521011 RepID=B8GHV8_METPE|nr:DNA sulfur modification protein DndB [Methanosphaerula palustris]ACL16698.1 DNA sulfur modification protein DndB [Methanosphaerula palustris E1-9c]